MESHKCAIQTRAHTVSVLINYQRIKLYANCELRFWLVSVRTRDAYADDGSLCCFPTHKSLGIFSRIYSWHTQRSSVRTHIHIHSNGIKIENMCKHTQNIAREREPLTSGLCYFYWLFVLRSKTHFAMSKCKTPITATEKLCKWKSVASTEYMCMYVLFLSLSLLLSFRFFQRQHPTSRTHSNARFCVHTILAQIPYTLKWVMKQGVVLHRLWYLQ